jgi:hypothetical protein
LLLLAGEKPLLDEQVETLLVDDLHVVDVAVFLGTRSEKTIPGE